MGNGIKKEMQKLVKEIETKYQTNLADRIFDFAVQTLKHLNTFPKEKRLDVIQYQLSKSVTSIGANYEEAQGASSKKDFVYKISICLKEARESNYFLRIIDALGIIESEKSKLLIQESEEIKKMLGAILVKAKKSIDIDR